MKEVSFQAKNGFIKREIAGEILLVPVGERTREFNGMIMLNETGGYLWDLLAGPKTEAALLEALLQEFDVDPETAKADLQEFLNTGLQNELISESE